MSEEAPTKRRISPVSRFAPLAALLALLASCFVLTPATTLDWAIRIAASGLAALRFAYSEWRIRNGLA